VLRKVSMGLGLGALIVAMGAGGVAAKPSSKKTKIHCTATAYNVAYPQLSGLALGVLKCSQPFGDGVQKANNKTSVTGTRLTVTGTFTNYFDNGTNHGSIHLSGTIGSGEITASGSLSITGGTGAYKHVAGTGRATCTTRDAGKTFDCTVSGTMV